MAGKNNLSLAIVVKLLTDNFNKGANKVKSTLLTMQRNFYAFAAAAGAGTLGLSNFLSKMIQVSKETSRASIALKNVSGSTASFADNQKWLLDLAKRYGVEINSLTTGFAKFKAAADISSMSLDDQRKIFESVARASVAFGLSAEDQRGVFMALSQMMSKNKVMAEELRLQLAERMPVAIQAMAKAVGVSVNKLDAMMKQGKVMSADVLPKFADALNELIANPDLDNLNKSLVDLSNTFQQLVEKLGIGDLFKRAVETATKALATLADNTKNVMAVIYATIAGVFVKGLTSIFKGFAEDYDGAVQSAVKSVEKGAASAQRAEKAMAGLEVAQARVTQTELAYNKALGKRDKVLEKLSKISADDAQKREKIEADLAMANAKVKIKEANLHKAMEGEKTAASKLAAVQQTVAVQASAGQQQLAAQATATGWTRAYNIMSLGAKRLFVNLKAMLAANIWAIALAAVTALATKLAQAAKSAIDIRKNIKNIGEWEATSEMRELDEAREYLNASDANVRAGALAKINDLLGTQLTFEDDINKAIEERLKILGVEERVRKAKAEFEQAEAWQNETGSSADRNVREKDVAPYRAEYEQALKEYFRITGRQYGEKSSAITPASYGPKVVNINPNEITDNGKYTRENLAQALSASLNKYADKFVAQKEFQDIINQQRDTSGDWKLTPTEILEADALFAQDKFNEMLRYAGEKGTLLGTELGEQLGEAMANASTLKDAVRFAEMLDALKEAQAGLRSITLNGIEGAVSDIDSVVNAFDRLNQAIDEDATAWEKIMATFELFSSTIQAVVGIIETVTQAQEAAAMVKAMTAQTTIAANTGEAASEVGAKVAAESGGWAALVAVPAAISAILAAFAMIPKFANGGIVSGGPKQGDKILARLNAGEAVLTPTGLASLHDAADPKNVRNIRITGHLVGRGRDLQAILDTENKYRNRIG